MTWPRHNPQAKLTLAQAVFIRQAWDHGAMQLLLARHFKISRAQINRIINGLYWRRA